MLWDVDGGLPLVDKYLYSNDNHVVAGALLAVGIINCGVRNECDPVGPICQFLSNFSLFLFLYSRSFAFCRSIRIGGELASYPNSGQTNIILSGLNK